MEQHALLKTGTEHRLPYPYGHLPEPLWAYHTSLQQKTQWSVATLQDQKVYLQVHLYSCKVGKTVERMEAPAICTGQSGHIENEPSEKHQSIPKLDLKAGHRALNITNLPFLQGKPSPTNPSGKTYPEKSLVRSL